MPCLQQERAGSFSGELWVVELLLLGALHHQQSSELGQFRSLVPGREKWLICESRASTSAPCTLSWVLLLPRDAQEAALGQDGGETPAMPWMSALLSLEACLIVLVVNEG